MTFVSTHVRRRRRTLAVTYALVSIENTFELLYPFAIGLAVNGLLDQTWTGIAVFAAISLSHTAVSFTRQRYDSRSFAKLYAEIATDLVHQQRDDGVATSAIAGRANLAGEYVDFLERDIPLAITACFAVFGSLLMLLLYDPLLGLVASAVAFPVALLNRRLMRRSRRIYRRLNDQTEAEVAVIGTGTHGEVRRHFWILGLQWVRLSDAEAASWSIMEVLAAGLAVFALWRTVDIGAEVGTIFATIAYVMSYIGGFERPHRSSAASQPLCAARCVRTTPSRVQQAVQEGRLAPGSAPGSRRGRRRPVFHLVSGLSWCAPWDLNPEPADQGAATFCPAKTSQYEEQGFCPSCCPVSPRQTGEYREVRHPVWHPTRER